MKKIALIVIGVSVLAVSGYATGQILTKKNSGGDFVQLEDGRKMRISGAGGGEFSREGERADVVGKIKSMTDEQMVVEKFEMSGMGAGRGSNVTQDGEKPTTPTERPEPTILGEETIIFSESTSYVKGLERGRGGKEGRAENTKLEELSIGDLKEGSIVSVWLSEDGASAQRIMVR